MEGRERSTVLVVGNAEFDEAPFAGRQLALIRVTAETASAQFNDARAILVAEPVTKLGSVKRCYESVFPEAKNYELWCGTLAYTVEHHAQVDAIRKTVSQASDSRIVPIAELEKTAEEISRLRVGPPAGDPVFEPAAIALSPEQRLLLRRAFGDCREVFLEPMPGGKASLFVFRAHASLKEWRVGPRPLPFFLKIAGAEEIEKEKGKYREYAEHYIPFNLRPNLDRRRCIRTQTYASLVGNFVDDALPLRVCLRSGYSGVVFALFETSLKGFRLQPFAAGDKPHEDFLAGFVRERIWLQELENKGEVLNRAKSLGLASTVASLERAVCKAASGVSCFVAPYHGDLHAGNVMVRGGDAILIDFSSAEMGPLTADPAALEVSLMFGTDELDVPNSFGDWRGFIDEMYGTTILALRHPGLFSSKPNRYAWLRRSLRELRHVLLACEGNPVEAMVVLATNLMRYSRLDVEELPNDELRELARRRHAYALVIAERLVNGFPGGPATKGVK